MTEAIKAFILMLLVKGLTTGQSSLQLTLTLEMLLDFQSIPQLSAAVNNRRNLFGQGDAGSPPGAVELHSEGKIHLLAHLLISW